MAVSASGVSSARGPDRGRILTLVRLGGVAGLATCLVYPLLVFAPLPDLAAVVLAAFMGPLLGAASWGLRYFIDLGAPTVGAELGAISNVLAGALLTAIRHPRFGRLAGGSGILIGVALLVLNLATFPDPPADAGLADLGPLLGLWYLAVSVRLLGSWNWAVTRAREQAAATPAA